MNETANASISTWVAAKYYLGKHFAAGRFVWLISFGWFTGTIFTRMVPALFIARILTNVSDGKTSWDTNASLFLFGVGSVLFGEFLIKSALYYQSIIANRVSNTILVESHDLLLKKSLAFHADRFAGDLTSKVTKLSERSVFFIDNLYIQVATFLGMFLFAVIVLGKENLLAVACYIAALALYSLIAAPLVKRRVKLIEKRSRMKSQQTGLLVDSLTNISAIKSFAREKEENTRFKEHVEETGQVVLSSWLYSLFKVDPLTIIFYCLMIFGPLAAVLFLADGTNITQLFLMYTYLTLLGSRIWDFARVWRDVEVYLTEAAEALEAIWTKVDVFDDPTSGMLEVSQGKITFNEVDFSYLQGTDLFSNFSAIIEPQQKVGLVGPSGGGKTTLLKLLLRFMDTQSGSITIDKQNIESVSQTSLRDAIAYIPQEPVLFHRTVAQNILYGQPNLDDEAMHQAARQAFAHDFIVDLPNGYNTLVGERGIKLSGGQRQRIAIARAFLKPAKILVLDEATSALDSESEQLIQDALAKLIAEKTVVSIAHRLSTLQIMDRLLVIQEGQIIEDGSHSELVKANGLYTQLWQHQSGGYL